MEDVSPNFKPNEYDMSVISDLLRYEGTPLAIQFFSNVCLRLTDYSYWFFLSTLWVSYSGHTDLKLWRRLFQSSRSNRKTSIMKPSEVMVFNLLPDELTVYRAHRSNETDWISYTLNQDIAKRFAKERGVCEIIEYRLNKKDVIALFLRRSEQEIIMLKPYKLVKVQAICIVTNESESA